MITPKEANALKPAERRWLTENEDTIDESLKSKYSGQTPVSIFVPRPPFPRDVLIIVAMYEQHGWQITQIHHNTHIEFVFSAVDYPDLPGLEEKPTPKTESPTAWDRISLENEE